MSEEKQWVRYRHKSNRAIEYDVESLGGAPLVYDGGEWGFYRIRTIRNISLPEEVHRPAYTMMPADKFLETYEEAV